MTRNLSLLPMNHHQFWSPTFFGCLLVAILLHHTTAWTSPHYRQLQPCHDLTATTIPTTATTTTTTSFSTVLLRRSKHHKVVEYPTKKWSCSSSSTILWAKSDDIDDASNDNDDLLSNKEGNPYQDPNYPDLEFVDYSDPDYQVDQGIGDEFFDPTSNTEIQIEAMREERRIRNDEYQFETYYKEILKSGEEFKGEWSVFYTSTFIDGTVDATKERGKTSRPPRLVKAAGPLKVISRGERIELDRQNGDDTDDKEDAATATTVAKTTTDRLAYQRIVHHERVFTDLDYDANTKSDELLKQEQISMSTQFWPTELSSLDFRGHQGIMCVGNAYTICTAVPLSSSTASSSAASDNSGTNNITPTLEGPFAEYRAELGLLSDIMRFRIKLDYSILDDDKELDDAAAAPPALHLKSLTVCRETVGMWPRAERYQSAIEAITQDALWGPRGAEGGLYDPPPVGSEEQASQYLLLDLEGRATILLPYVMDQDPDAHSGYGWVTSLDWTPGKNRFQVDRKTTGGKHLLGLRTLELSEVESASAERYRPRDGGSNMRQ